MKPPKRVASKETASTTAMRGGYVRGGHSRAYEPTRNRDADSDQGTRTGKKVRKEAEGEGFAGGTSMVPREEEWMVEGGNERNETESDDSRKLRNFSEAVKGGKKPVSDMEAEEPPASMNKSQGSEGDPGGPFQYNHREGEEMKKQSPEIRVEKVNGVFNFAPNEAAIKRLRHPWWDTLIVKLLG
ncbi:hypothetical protein PIB30_049974 [Stylosanthes scabra]|uniref:Uncharacterized protein n=1 Tax=Stylosanthes scabra TaxID=79078 RepID=A0ABU6ZG83_9FABA|nr:hypothetical protein [Stylosanthes scabra]